MKFHPLETEQVNRLRTALRNNRHGNDGATLLMDADTSFAGEAPDLPSDTEVINAVKAMPVHY